MAIGYYVSEGIISYVGSLNQKATRYWSKSACLLVGDDS